MNLNESFPVSPEKIKNLRSRIERLGIDPSRIREQFTRGCGHGGQKVNKTANAVILHYSPLDLVVKVHRERQRSLNRFLALRELVDQVEMRISPHTSARMKEWEKIRRRKKKKRKRSQEKYQSMGIENHEINP